MKELTTVEELDSFISGEGVKVIDFYVSWCEPCNRFLRIADRVEVALAEFGAEIAKINCETSKELAAAFEVKAYPTFVFIKNKVPHTVYFGIKPIAEMQNIVNQILDNN